MEYDDVLTDGGFGLFNPRCHPQRVAKLVVSRNDDWRLSGCASSGGQAWRCSWLGTRRRPKTSGPHVHKGSPTDRPRFRRGRVSRHEVSHNGPGCLGTGNGGDGVPVSVLEKVNGRAECMERILWL
jgi:hypothetical protein